jgi:hypothetical protein
MKVACRGFEKRSLILRCGRFVLCPKSITRAHAMSEVCAVSQKHISNALMKRCFVIKSYIAPIWRFVSFEKLSSRTPMGGFFQNKTLWMLWETRVCDIKERHADTETSLLCHKDFLFYYSSMPSHDMEIVCFEKLTLWYERLFSFSKPTPWSGMRDARLCIEKL